MQASGKEACFQFPERSLFSAKIMQASGKEACFQFPERSLFSAKIRIFLLSACLKGNFFCVAACFMAAHGCCE